MRQPPCLARRGPRRHSSRRNAQGLVALAQVHEDPTSELAYTVAIVTRHVMLGKLILMFSAQRLRANMRFVLSAAAACPATVFGRRGKHLHYLQPPSPLGIKPSQRALTFVSSVRLWVYANTRPYLLRYCCPLSALACRLARPLGRQARDLHFWRLEMYLKCSNNARAGTSSPPHFRAQDRCPHHVSLLQRLHASSQRSSTNWHASSGAAAL